MNSVAYQAIQIKRSLNFLFYEIPNQARTLHRTRLKIINFILNNQRNRRTFPFPPSFPIFSITLFGGSSANHFKLLQKFLPLRMTNSIYFVLLHLLYKLLFVFYHFYEKYLFGKSSGESCGRTRKAWQIVWMSEIYK